MTCSTLLDDRHDDDVDLIADLVLHPMIAIARSNARKVNAARRLHADGLIDLKQHPENWSYLYVSVSPARRGKGAR